MSKSAIANGNQCIVIYPLCLAQLLPDCEAASLASLAGSIHRAFVECDSPDQGRGSQHLEDFRRAQHVASDCLSDGHTAIVRLFQVTNARLNSGNAIDHRNQSLETRAADKIVRYSTKVDDWRKLSRWHGSLTLELKELSLILRGCVVSSVSRNRRFSPISRHETAGRLHPGEIGPPTVSRAPTVCRDVRPDRAARACAWGAQVRNGAKRSGHQNDMGARLGASKIHTDQISMLFRSLPHRCASSSRTIFPQNQKNVVSQ